MDGCLGKERVMDGDGRTDGGEEVWSLMEQRGDSEGEREGGEKVGGGVGRGVRGRKMWNEGRGVSE